VKFHTLTVASSKIMLVPMLPSTVHDPADSRLHGIEDPNFSLATETPKTIASMHQIASTRFLKPSVILIEISRQGMVRDKDLYTTKTTTVTEFCLFSSRTFEFHRVMFKSRKLLCNGMNCS
jgi:hypothetical protein